MTDHATARDRLSPPRIPRRFVWPDLATLTLAVVLAFAAGVIAGQWSEERHAAPMRAELEVVRANLERLRSEPETKTTCIVGNRGVQACVKVYRGDS